MTKHTPGPWTAYSNVVRAKGRFVATASHYPIPGELSEDRSQSNARLIAAAPDLLEACKFVDGYFGKAFGFDCADPDCEVCEAHKRIVAAIQKAEGNE